METNFNSIIAPADEYEYVDDICIISTYFNPHKYKSKKENFDAFLAPIKKANINYLIVECSTVNGEFELEKSKNIIRVFSKHVLWQKERLLNIALNNLEDRFKKIVWLDCDILFTNKSWLKQTSDLLNKYMVIQPFKYAIRLPAKSKYYNGIGEKYNSFGYIYSKYPNCMTMGNFDLHGHTGFAWAIQRKIIQKIGLYDACISGSGDHVMAHAFCGDWHTICMERVFVGNKYFFKHYEKWCNKVYKRVKGGVTYTGGIVLHLWHGDPQNRRYLERMKLLSDNKFNPAKDLKLNECNCWELNANSGHLSDGISKYFEMRLEDDN